MKYQKEYDFPDLPLDKIVADLGVKTGMQVTLSRKSLADAPRYWCPHNHLYSSLTVKHQADCFKSTRVMIGGGGRDGKLGMETKVEHEGQALRGACSHSASTKNRLNRLQCYIAESGLFEVFVPRCIPVEIQRIGQQEINYPTTKAMRSKHVRQQPT